MHQMARHDLRAWMDRWRVVAETQDAYALGRGILDPAASLARGLDLLRFVDRHRRQGGIERRALGEFDSRLEDGRSRVLLWEEIEAGLPRDDNGVSRSSA